MYLYLSVVFYILVAIRLGSLYLSKTNEKRLKRLGAIEYGKRNSMALITAHIIFYSAVIAEGVERSSFLIDEVSFIGLAIYAFSIVILYYVIYSIRHVWTMKLIIAPTPIHRINKSFLFKYIKHPNYFLNIIPELIGFALVFHAWTTLFIGLPLYLIPLIIRIRQEERIMNQQFPEY